MALTNATASQSVQLDFGFQAASTRCTAQTKRMSLRPSLDVRLVGVLSRSALHNPGLDELLRPRLVDAVARPAYGIYYAMAARSLRRAAGKTFDLMGQAGVSWF